jgi:two-component system, OmpR family, phosphate regulon sensor histidine kinase PhoR
LRGTLLYQTRLTSPFSRMELIFSINQLPAGPGGAVLAWSAALLASVVTGGLYLMYRLSLGHIRLAQQQQDFVSAISHELKTPLTSIRMYGEMLREGWAPQEKKPEYYAFIHDESERLSRLINNVLHLARMTRNELPVDIKAVTVGELLDSIRSKITSSVEHAGAEMQISVAAGLRDRRVLVDQDCFTQIIINLVDNALKFSAKAASRAIEISCREGKRGTLMFAVRDYGPGIAPDQMSKIFQLFYRAENELTRETSGTGIGLALVQRLALAMGATVDATNMAPGAEFRLHLQEPK